jgi:hypothetical protein
MNPGLQLVPFDVEVPLEQYDPAGHKLLVPTDYMLF